jgi:hypothetical protein
MSLYLPKNIHPNALAELDISGHVSRVMPLLPMPSTSMPVTHPTPNSLHLPPNLCQT